MTPRKPSKVKPKAQKPRDKFGHTALMAAAHANRLDAARRLLARGADVSAVTLPDHEVLDGVFKGYAVVSGGDSALMLAARAASLAMVRLLVEAGADLQQMNAQHDTALANAVGGPDAAAKIRYLVGKGARTDPKGANAALYVAAAAGKAPIVALLLELGADVDGRAWTNSTALTAAARYGHLDVFRLLLDAKADIALRDSSGATPLHLAATAERDRITTPKAQRTKARQFYNEMAVLLIAAGAQVDVRDGDGNTALMLACHNNQEVTTQLLLERARPNLRLRNKSNRTALIEAVSMNAVGPLRQLLRHGASLKDRDEDGNTPLEIAESNGYAEMARLLAAAKAGKVRTAMPADIHAIYALGDYKAALAAYDGLSKKDAGDFAVLANSAYCLQQLGRNAEACVRFSAALKQRPTTQHLYRGLCYSQWATQAWDEMVTTAKLGVARDPRDAYCWQQLGLAYLGLKDYRSAVEPLEKAVELDPGNADALTSLNEARKKAVRSV